LDEYEGWVIAAHGRQFLVESADTVFNCVTRGKRSNIYCGDRVMFQPTSSSDGVIETLLPRTTLLFREDAWRRKILAANVSQAIAVVAATPPFHDELLTRILVAAETQGLRSLILQNKADLAASDSLAEDLERYRRIGYPVVKLSAKENVTPLLPYLERQVSILVGQSGVGKSTLINRLVPDVKARTQEISKALGSGRHTTTHTRLYRPTGDSAILDSPGLHAFGMSKLPVDRIAQAFPEFRNHIGKCRFRNCRHQHEPGCAILDAADNGDIDVRRFHHFQNLVRESSQG
jgi:ribosome biogenesis GTPase / thiamine phosphate phosphatase